MPTAKAMINPTQPLLTWLKSTLRRAGLSRPHEEWARASSSASSSIREELPRLEAIFLDISSHLEPITIQSEKLVTECEALLRLAFGIESGRSIVNRTSTLLQGPLHYIDGCLAVSGHLKTSQPWSLQNQPL